MAASVQEQSLVQGGHIKTNNNLPSTFTSSTLARNIVDTMTDHIAHGRLRDMARVFHENCCPGDWTQGDQVSLSCTMYAFYQLGERSEDVGLFEATIRFRWEAALLIDHIVEMFSLPVPRNEICILWDDNTWRVNFPQNASISASEFKQRWRTIAAPLKDSFDLPRLPQQGPPFRRPFRYLMAALLEAHLSEDSLATISAGIIDLMDKVRAFHQQRLCENQDVRRTGHEWLEFIL